MSKKTEGMEVIVLDDRLKELKRATDGSAGIDLHACSFDGLRLQGRATVPPQGTFTIGTGVKIHIGSMSDALVGMVFPRSSLGKRGLALQNTVGIIDSDYQGEIVLICRNESRHILTIDPTERVAQMVVVPTFRSALVPVKQFAATDRGEGGFGSTGK